MRDIMTPFTPPNSSTQMIGILSPYRNPEKEIKGDCDVEFKRNAKAYKNKLISCINIQITE